MQHLEVSGAVVPTTIVVVRRQKVKNSQYKSKEA